MPVRMAAIDSSLQFKGNDFDRNTNIDLLAIAKYAAEKSTAECLTPAPEPVNEPEPEPEQQAADSYPESNARYGGRRPYTVDDDRLLDDEDDDYMKRTTKSPGRVRPDRFNPDFDDDGFDEQSSDNKSIISRIKSGLAKFWADPKDNDDDMDEPTI